MSPVLQDILQHSQNRRFDNLAVFAVLREYDYGRSPSIKMTHRAVHEKSIVIETVFHAAKKASLDIRKRDIVAAVTHTLGYTRLRHLNSRQGQIDRLTRQPSDFKRMISR